ncbi:NAD(P)/FAD-dependent oxidoreductase [Subtercola vilae]|uniref:NAD(P)/FAD-dependent oxidoreductase n=1 Tax=Subtercola vilae TaxID=2056433 RepID=A0A4V4RES2_9MICO|nr:NAD(P)/FAD-dependent oxidoreductase [Subtercola vilae]TIH33564.1 NAD(P)/FAD-dependent oxidoreductase [Subtercola vilae]
MIENSYEDAATTESREIDHSQPWEVVIVGGGAAGLSAALILARARRRVLVLDGGEPRNRFAPHLHGMISRDGYSPLQLVEDGRREVRAADGVIETAHVVSVRRLTPAESADADARATPTPTTTNVTGGATAANLGTATRAGAAALTGIAPARFELTTESGASIRAGRIIVATGIRDELPPIEGLAEHWGRGVVACPYCDGFEARGRAIGVLAGSVPALHKAHLLRAYSDDVTVFTALAGPVPTDDLRALAARGIAVDDRPIARIVSTDGRLTGVALDDGTIVARDVMFVDGRMIALDALLTQLGAQQSDTMAGPWTTVDATFKTTVDGVWAIGNSASPFALVPIAAASGVVAAATINAELVQEDVARALAAWQVAA